MWLAKQLRWCSVGLMLLALTGCQTEELKLTNVARSGSNLVPDQWDPISPFESSISIRDETEGEVVRRAAKRNVAQKLYSEAMQLSYGHMLFERRKNIPEGSFHSADQELLRRYNNNREFKEFGIRLTPTSVRRQESEDGAISFAVEQGESHKCLAFFRYSSASRSPAGDGKGFYEAITGASCASLGSSEANTLEQDALRLAKRVIFDNGRLSRSQLFAEGLAQLDLDKSGPEIIIPYSVRTQESTVVLEGQVEDESGVKSLTLGGHPINLSAEGYFKVRVPVPAGTSKVTFEAVDLLGNRSTMDVAVVRGAAEDTGSFVPERSYALLFAVKEYHDTRIPTLDTVVNDVNGVAKTLQERYGYQVKVVKNSSRAEILAAIEEMRNKLSDRDDLLIYYAGHGIEHKKRGYWITSDALTSNADTWLPNSEVERRLREVPSRRVLMVSDSCFSGTLTAEKIEQPPAAPGFRSRTAISSGGLEPVEDDDGSGHSPFAHYFIDVLNADKGHDLTAFDLFKKVKTLVMRSSSQRPQYGAILTAGHTPGGGYYFQ